MRKGKYTWRIMLVLGLLFVSGNVKMVQAEDYSYLTKWPPMIYGTQSLDKKGNTTIEWSSVTDESMDESAAIVYEIQVSKNTAFTNAKQYSAKEATLTLNKSAFGTNGGRFYVRVRLVVDYADAEQTDLVSDWSEVKEMTFVKINKKNFPGLYKVLKNGGKRYNLSANKVETVTYDQNGDSWLDPAEIEDIWMIGTQNISQKVNGANKIVKATDISSFQGVEYLDKLHYINIARFSGKKADFSKSSVDTVWITGVSSKQITVVSPTARTVHVEADYKTKLTKMDLSKCSNAVELGAYGNKGTKTLKLPKNKKKLKVLSVSDIGIKSLNMNAYTKLQQLYVYGCDVKSVKVNKCKNLRYIYFWCCDHIKSLNLKSNKKLRGADFYKTPGLTSSTVKRPKNGKYTWNKGKWWYSTSAYKKDMKKLYN